MVVNVVVVVHGSRCFGLTHASCSALLGPRLDEEEEEDDLQEEDADDGDDYDDDYDDYEARVFDGCSCRRLG